MGENRPGHGISLRQSICKVPSKDVQDVWLGRPLRGCRPHVVIRSYDVGSAASRCRDTWQPSSRSQLAHRPGAYLDVTAMYEIRCEYRRKPDVRELKCRVEGGWCDGEVESDGLRSVRWVIDVWFGG